MEVGTSGSPCAADQSDNLTGLDTLPFSNMNCAHMSIMGKHVLPVVQEHSLAVTPVTFPGSAECYGSIRARTNGFAFPRANIDSAMENASAITEWGRKNSRLYGKLKLGNAWMFFSVEKIGKVGAQVFEPRR